MKNKYIIQKKVISLAIASSLIITSLSAEDFASRLKTSLNDKFNVNTTSAGAWKDPGSGITYYSGGGISVSFNTTKNFPSWVDAREPSLHMGCGSFDFDAGFASIIDLDGITSQLSSAGTSLIGGFMSSILYSTPILGDIIKTVKKIADQISAMLANACSLGQQLGTSMGTKDISLATMENSGVGFIKGLKSYGVVKNAVSSIEDTATFGKMKSGLKCLGSSDYSNCMAGSKTKKAPQSESKDAFKRAGINNVVTSPLLKGIKVIASAKDPFIDRISLSDYLDGTKKSFGKHFQPSSIVKNSGSKLMKFLILSQANNIRFANSKLCNTASKYYGFISDSNSSGTDDDLKSALKNGLLTEKLYNIPKEGQVFPIWDENGIRIHAFEPKKDLVPFILTGKSENNESVAMQKAYIYVTQFSISKSKVERKIFMCRNTTDNTLVTANWNGFGTVAKVTKDIQSIADDSTPTEGSYIVAEAAKLANILGKKEKLLTNSYTIFAPTLTARNIALMNNYLLLGKVIDALHSANDTFKDAVGVTADATLNPSSQKTLSGYKTKLRKELENAVGAERFMDAFIRDANNIENKYKIMNEKAKKGIR